MLCSLFAGSQCPMSSSFYSFLATESWKCSVQMHKHHSGTVTWEGCPSTALSLSPH